MASLIIERQPQDIHLQEPTNDHSHRLVTDMQSVRYYHDDVGPKAKKKQSRSTSKNTQR